jgi:hypothetical protein
LVATLIVQQGLNASRFRWRRVLFDFIDALQRGIGEGDKGYRTPFLSIGKLAEAGHSLGEPIEAASASPPT